jgi:hypothetical protein
VPQLTFITVVDLETAPNQFFLIRDEGDPAMDDSSFVWCGRALGWLPNNKTTFNYRVWYPSLELAAEAACEYVKWPVQNVESK